MRNVRLILLALVFGLSACSFSFASGPGPYSGHSRTLAGMHGHGKPARRAGRDAAPVLAKADRPAKPAEADAKPEPPRKPPRVGRADPPEPEPPLRVGRVNLPKPEPSLRIGRVNPPKPEPSVKRKILVAGIVVDPKATRPEP